jgi:hypothetical protein
MHAPLPQKDLRLATRNLKETPLRCWAQGEDSEGMEVDSEGEGEGLPSYEFRFETAKLLLELDPGTEAAIQVTIGRLTHW